jgi:ribosome-associated toxin RatA of RatAB toxin-antitoxin module
MIGTRRTRLRSAAAAALLVSSAALAGEISVDAAREGDAIRVTARAVLEAPHALIWQTLTDYDRLHEFIPGMQHSRVIETRGPATIVEERGEARFLVFSYPIEVTVASVHRPPETIEIHLLKGNLRTLEGAYRIEPLPDGKQVLHWTGLIAPALALPDFVTRYLMRANVEDQFRGMVQEIERRDDVRRNGAGTPNK